MKFINKTFNIKGVLCGVWIFCLHLNFVYLNTKREDLLRYWLKLSYEIKPKKEIGDRIINFSRNAIDEHFWIKVNQANYVIHILTRPLIYLITILVCLPYFSIKVDLNFVTFWLIAFLNYVVFLAFYHFFTLELFDLALFPVILLSYFVRKYKILKDQIQSLRNNELRIDNDKLHKLIYDFDTLTLHMITTNEYWKFLFGINFIFVFIQSIFTVFLALSCDLILRIVLSFILALSSMFNIFIPFYLENQILKEMNYSNNILQLLSFYPEVTVYNKRKINYITFYLRDGKWGCEFLKENLLIVQFFSFIR